MEPTAALNAQDILKALHEISERIANNAHIIFSQVYREIGALLYHQTQLPIIATELERLATAVWNLAGNVTEIEVAHARKMNDLAMSTIILALSPQTSPGVEPDEQ